jgi:hypothetical protein
MGARGRRLIRSGAATVSLELALLLTILGGAGCAAGEAALPSITGPSPRERVEPAECRRRCGETREGCVQLLYELHPLGPIENEAPRTSGHQFCYDVYLHCVDVCGTIP